MCFYKLVIHTLDLIIIILIFNFLIYSNSYAKHQYEEYSFNAFWKYEIKGSDNYYKFNSDLTQKRQKGEKLGGTVEKNQLFCILLKIGSLDFF